MHKMVLIKYKRKFIDGVLEGLEIDQEWKTDARLVPECIARMDGKTIGREFGDTKVIDTFVSQEVA